MMDEMDECSVVGFLLREGKLKLSTKVFGYFP